MTSRGSIIVFCAVAVIVFLFLVMEGTHTKRRVIENALRYGLIRCYISATNESQGVISTNTIRLIIQQDLALPVEKNHLLSSFVTNGMVSFAEKPVAVGSDDVIWAVKLGSKYLCIKGNEDFGLLSESEFDNWKHMQN